MDNLQREEELPCKVQTLPTAGSSVEEMVIFPVCGDLCGEINCGNSKCICVELQNEPNGAEKTMCESIKMENSSTKNAPSNSSLEMSENEGISKNEHKKNKKDSNEEAKKTVRPEEVNVAELNKLSKHEFLQLQRKLLFLERDMENEREMMKTVNKGEGIPGVLPHLELVSYTSTQYGRYCITFASYAHKTLPSHGLRKGDNVSIYKGGPMCRPEDHCREGVVADVSSQDINITVDEPYEFEESSSYSVKHYPSLENIHRILNSLRHISNVQGPASHLCAALFNEEPLKLPLPRLPPKLCLANSDELVFFNKKLDASQREAVEFVVKQQDLAVVHGPPGTGKTTTLIEIIRQHVQMGVKVLALAPSNLGVDNLVERLDVAGLRVVRIGHPARTTPATQRHTIDALMHRNEGREVVEDIQRDICSLTKKLNFIRGWERKGIYKELGQLRKELNERQDRMFRHLVKGADVVLCTLLSAHANGAMRCLDKDHFGLTVIDECSQGTEASCYLSILRSSKLVLAGDHKQLPPTVLCPEASKLLVSLMERVVDLYGNQVVRMLSVQYRMHSDIMRWSSAAIYGDKLVAHQSVAAHLLHDLPSVTSCEHTDVPLLLVDTSSCPGFEESEDTENTSVVSRSNEGEASIVLALVKKLIRSGLEQHQLAVITPYSMQVKLVRSLVHEDFPDVEVQTVDGFQGREKEAVILTLVRSNVKGEIGFLAEDRRLNVAVTRARRHLSVVCDTRTLQQHHFLRGFVIYMTERARVVRAEHIDEGYCWMLGHMSLSVDKELRQLPDTILTDTTSLCEDFVTWKNNFVDSVGDVASCAHLVRLYQYIFLRALGSRPSDRYTSEFRGSRHDSLDFKAMMECDVSMFTQWALSATDKRKSCRALQLLDCEFRGVPDFYRVIEVMRAHIVDSFPNYAWPVAPRRFSLKIEVSLEPLSRQDKGYHRADVDFRSDKEYRRMDSRKLSSLKVTNKENYQKSRRKANSPYHRSSGQSYRHGRWNSWRRQQKL